MTLWISLHYPGGSFKSHLLMNFLRLGFVRELDYESTRSDNIETTQDHGHPDHLPNRINIFRKL